VWQEGQVSMVPPGAKVSLANQVEQGLTGKLAKTDFQGGQGSQGWVALKESVVMEVIQV
jgi:hypothetical protein